MAAYRGGARTAATCVGVADQTRLAGIGCSAQELFDFVEDACGWGEPTFAEVLEVSRIRRQYFLERMGGRPSDRVVPAEEFPAKTDEVDGVAWLPRLIRKAEAKLRGELPPELMYGCGGDRPFLRRAGLGLAEFLAVVRDADGDYRGLIERVKTGLRAG